MRATLLLCAALPFAAGFECLPQGGACPNHDAVCPNLECEDGFAVDEDGCELCECAAPATDGGHLDDGGQSGITSCMSDQECAPTQFCDVVNFCDSPCDAGQECPPVCLGRCVDATKPDDCVDMSCSADAGSANPTDAGAPSDPCFGAFLDQNGTCRGPADEVLDDTCCAREA